MKKPGNNEEQNTKSSISRRNLLRAGLTAPFAGKSASKKEEPLNPDIIQALIEAYNQAATKLAWARNLDGLSWRMDKSIPLRAIAPFNPHRPVDKQISWIDKDISAYSALLEQFKNKANILLNALGDASFTSSLNGVRETGGASIGGTISRQLLESVRDEQVKKSEALLAPLSNREELIKQLETQHNIFNDLLKKLHIDIPEDGCFLHAQDVRDTDDHSSAYFDAITQIERNLPPGTHWQTHLSNPKAMDEVAIPVAEARREAIAKIAEKNAIASSRQNPSPQADSHLAEKLNAFFQLDFARAHDGFRAEIPLHDNEKKAAIYASLIRLVERFGASAAIVPPIEALFVNDRVVNERGTLVHVPAETPVPKRYEIRISDDLAHLLANPRDIDLAMLQTTGQSQWQSRVKQQKSETGQQL